MYGEALTVVPPPPPLLPPLPEPPPALPLPGVGVTPPPPQAVTNTATAISRLARVPFEVRWMETMAVQPLAAGRCK